MHAPYLKSRSFSFFFQNRRELSYSMRMTDLMQNLFVFFRALPTMLKCVLSGGWLKKGLDEPAGNIFIQKDFFGVCAASGAEPADDDYVVARLKELSIRRVRVDFTYESRNSFQARFLRRLIDENFQVCLHLVQPFAEARKILHDEEAQKTWRLFLAETFAAYGCGVELFEIGSTCNRRKWSGYNLNGYLTAWRIAGEEAAAANCALAGPNVTDFEPFYNIAILSAMKRMRLLPTLHSDNLFVERAGEPEVYDHKIAGRRPAEALKFNLIRKARILNGIGEKFGVARTVCSHVSWSLRRIARFTDQIEEKQADYLARYCCLAATSGALERVYWGPLIGQREGLIDDGTAEFPEIPHVTFYGTARGKVENYRPRPAFFALQTVNRFIAGAEYVRKVPSAPGLEIHEFKRPDCFLHVAWTRDGIKTAAKECYQPGILEEAKIYSRDGALLEKPPIMISESPVYIKWPGRGFVGAGLARPVCPEGLRPAKPLPAVPSRPPSPLENIRFANLAGRSYDFVSRADWSGVCLAGNKDAIFQRISLLRQNIDREAEVLRDSRNRVWRIMFGDDKDAAVIIKQCKPLPPLRRLFAKRRGDKALRSWNGANELLRRGIATPLPIAFFHHAEKPLVSPGWYVCEDFGESFSARDAFNAFSSGVDGFAGLPTDRVYGEISSFVLKMHDRGVYFRDLSAGNLLFRIRDGKAVEFTLIDTARARFYCRRLGLRRRLFDLMRICHPLCWNGRRIFIGKYMASMGRRYRFWMNVPFYYYDLKHWVKRKLRPWRR